MGWGESSGFVGGSGERRELMGVGGEGLKYEKGLNAPMMAYMPGDNAGGYYAAYVNSNQYDEYNPYNQYEALDPIMEEDDDASTQYKDSTINNSIHDKMRENATHFFKTPPDNKNPYLICIYYSYSLYSFLFPLLLFLILYYQPLSSFIY